MRFSVTAVIRLATIGFLGSSVAAIGLARLVPEGRGWRMPCKNTYVNLPANLLGVDSEPSRWLDVSRAEITTLRLPASDALLYTSAAPWVDEQGRSEAVGRWSHYEGAMREMTETGLARISFPDGELRDVVHTDILPTSAPTWYPGTGSRVLFAAGDGLLYHYEFGAKAERHSGTGSPEPVVWDCEMPGGEGAIISDPHWVTDSHVGSIVLVSLRSRENSSGKERLGTSRIWWLRLDDEGRKILEAGMLTDAKAGPADCDERCPSTGRDSSGETILAYQRRIGSHNWAMFVAPLVVDRQMKRPIQLTRVGRMVADRCHPLQTVFSRDGRWVGIIAVSGGGYAMPRRISLEATADLVSLMPRDPVLPR